MLSAFFIHIAVIIVIYAILAVSLNVAVGYTGLLNLGHIAFFGIGAYTSALLTKNDVPYIMALLASGIFASVFGWLLAKITSRLKGDYLSLATLGFGFVVYAVMLNWSKLTRGPLGIAGIEKPNIFGWYLKGSGSYLIFASIIAAIIIFIIYKIVKSRYGRLLEAVRDDAIGAQALGKNIYKLKIQGLMISAFFAGIAGSLYAHYISYIDPSTFFISDIIVIFTIVIVGGLASLRGSVISAIIILGLPEMLRFVDLPSSMIGPMRQMMFAVILILILMFKPRGLFGKIDLE